MTKGQNKNDENSMKNIRIEKLVINLCVGESGDKLTKACKVINENITQNQKNSLLIIF